MINPLMNLFVYIKIKSEAFDPNQITEHTLFLEDNCQINNGLENSLLFEMGNK